MNLEREPATTAPHGSGRPFRPGQSLNPYACYYRTPFAFSAFSYPLAQQLPLRVTCHSQSAGVGGQLDLPRSRSCRPDTFGTVRLAPVFSPATLMTTCPFALQGQPVAHPVLVWACQPLWPIGSHEVYQRFTYVAHTELALHLTPHGGWQCRPLPRHRGGPHSTGTLSPELHTRSLPIGHVWIGNCWSYNRSRHNIPCVTRQKRALPPTACRLTRG